ncbi:MAG: hypothetical protein MRK02_07685 [Candidatus Scalindua sp.]|nr:hypothetical protein [Candidatus Scalindua sp.]
MEKIHEMVVKCVQVLDPEIRVVFKDVPAGYALPDKKEIVLPDYQYDFFMIIKAAFHEVAHIMFSTDVSLSDLDSEEANALDTIEQAYVNYHFCLRYPKLEVTFNRFYKDSIEEMKGSGMVGSNFFWRELEYVLFDVDIGEGLQSEQCKKLYERGVIQDLWEVIKSSQSSKELVSGAKRLARECNSLDI